MSWTHPWADFVLPTVEGAVPVVEVPAAPADAAALRGMFAQHPTGIAAICAEIDGSRHGMVATSFSVGASFDPPLVLFAAQGDSRTWPLLSTAPRLGVSVLGETNAGAVRRLSSRTGDRFDGVSTARSVAGAVFVVDARLWLECRIVMTQELGDHTLVALEVVGASSFAGTAPLVYHDGQIVVAGTPASPAG